MKLLKKSLLVPRAIADVVAVFLKKRLTLLEKLSLAKALITLKYLANARNKNEVIDFGLGKKTITAYNNESLQFLIKELFIEKVYIVKIKTASKILDAGSNVGLSICYFKEVFPNAVIDAYEPDESSFAALEKNIAVNKINGVQVYKKAISDKNGFLYTSFSSNFGSVNTQFTDNEMGIKTEAVRLLDIIENGYDVIKLDIEGGEWRAMSDVILNKKLALSKNWLIEFHNGQGAEKFEEIKEAFFREGFKKEERGSVIYFYIE